MNLVGLGQQQNVSFLYYGRILKASSIGPTHFWGPHKPIENQGTQPFFSLRWTSLPSMQQPRSDFGIAWADDGRLFAIGGQTGSGKITETVEMLTSATADAANGTVNGCWSYVAPLSKPRKSHAVAFIAGRIVVAGGENECEVECFTLPTSDNTMGQWTQIYPLPKALAVLSLLPVDNCLISICTFTLNSFRQKPKL